MLHIAGVTLHGKFGKISANVVSPDGKRIMLNKTATSTSDEYISGRDLNPDDTLEIDENHISAHIMEDGHRRLYGRPPRRKGGTTSKSYNGKGHNGYSTYKNNNCDY